MTTNDVSEANNPFSHLAPDICALVEAVRRVIKDAVSDIEERIYKGGAGIGYHDRETGSLCGLFPRDNGVALMFSKGLSLPDPEGLIKYPGNSGQYIFFRAGQPIPEEALTQLILAALIFAAQ